MNNEFRALSRFQTTLPERNTGAGSAGGGVGDGKGLCSVIGERDGLDHGQSFLNRPVIDSRRTHVEIRGRSADSQKNNYQKSRSRGHLH